MPRNQEIDKAKKTMLLASIRRKDKLQAINDYIGFATAKSFGLIALIVGVFETVDPSILPINMDHPERAIAIGLALLTGNRIISLIAKVVNSIKS